MGKSIKTHRKLCVHAQFSVHLTEKCLKQKSVKKIQLWKTICQTFYLTPRSGVETQVENSGNRLWDTEPQPFYQTLSVQE